MKLLCLPGLSSGGMARQLLRREGQGDVRILPCSDDLTSGPLPGGVTLGRLGRIRHRYNAGLWRHEIAGASRPEGVLRDLLAEADETEIWLGATGREQLYLLAMNALIREAPLQKGRVIIRQYPLKDEIGSLGGHTVDDLANRPTAVDLTDELSLRLDEIWQAVRADSPEALFRLHHLGVGTDELPYLGRGLRDLVMSYPGLGNGLSEAETRLMTHLSPDWTKAARIVGEAMARLPLERTYYSDVALFADLVALADPSRPAPLAELRGDTRAMRHCEARSTLIGQDCLAERTNQIGWRGIDRWVGGVHLNAAKGPVWYRGPGDTLHDAEGKPC